MGTDLLMLRRDMLQAFRRGLTSADIVRFMRRLAQVIADHNPAQKDAVLAFRRDLMMKKTTNLPYATLVGFLRKEIAIVGSMIGNSQDMRLLSIRRDLMMAARRSDESMETLLRALQKLVGVVSKPKKDA